MKVGVAPRPIASVALVRDGPRIVTSPIAKRMERTPARIEIRAPQITRERLSRPRSSVPNGCDQLGAFRTWLQSVRMGWAGAARGAGPPRPRRSRRTAIIFTLYQRSILVTRLLNGSLSNTSSLFDPDPGV